MCQNQLEKINTMITLFNKKLRKQLSESLSELSKLKAENIVISKEGLKSYSINRVKDGRHSCSTHFVEGIVVEAGESIGLTFQEAAQIKGRQSKQANGPRKNNT